MSLLSFIVVLSLLLIRSSVHLMTIKFAFLKNSLFLLPLTFSTSPHLRRLDLRKNSWLQLLSWAFFLKNNCSQSVLSSLSQGLPRFSVLGACLHQERFVQTPPLSHPDFLQNSASLVTLMRVPALHSAFLLSTRSLSPVGALSYLFPIPAFVFLRKSSFLMRTVSHVSLLDFELEHLQICSSPYS